MVEIQNLLKDNLIYYNYEILNKHLGSNSDIFLDERHIDGPEENDNTFGDRIDKVTSISDKIKPGLQQKDSDNICKF